jgi:hypothetical protein
MFAGTMKHLPKFSLLLVLGFVHACGGDKEPVDVNGMYMLQTIVAANGCLETGFELGKTGELDITIAQDIKQSPEQVTLTISNLFVSGLLALAGLPNTFIGSVTGNSINAIGTGNARMENGCQFTPQISVAADLDRDALSGEITWSYVASGTNCGVKTTCKTVQTFNGTRPPTK